MTVIQQNIEDKKDRAIEVRQYTEHEEKLMKQWLKKNKPKQVGLQMDIMEYSRNVTKTQSKIGTSNGMDSVNN